MDAVVAGGKHRALHAVLQFAHISRPVVAHQQIDRTGGNPLDILVVLGIQLVDEMLRQQDDVAFAPRQRRHVDREDVQAIIEVLAEELLLHEFLQIAAGGGQEPHVGVQLLGSADPRKGPLLDETQQLDLGLEGEVADLVQEKRPALGAFRPADAAAHRAGEGALLMAEQLALDERFRQRRAIERDKRLVLAGRKRDDGAGDHLLAGAAGAADQYRGVRRRDLVDLSIDLLHLPAIADELAGIAVQHPAQFAVLRQQRLPLFMQLDI